MSLGNGFMSGLLRSSLRGLVSGNMLLIGVTGRKTGRQYVTPVNYLRDGDENLTAYLRRAPKLAGYFGVRLDAQSEPLVEDITHAARERVVIRGRPGAPE